MIAGTTNTPKFPCICEGGPWHAEVLWLGHTQATISMRIVKWENTSTSLHGMDGYDREWCGRYVKRVPEARAGVPGSSHTYPVLTWEPSNAQ